MALKELPPYCVLVEKRTIIPAEPKQKPGTKPVNNLIDRKGKLAQPVFVPRHADLSLSDGIAVHVVVQIKPPSIEPEKLN